MDKKEIIEKIKYTVTTREIDGEGIVDAIIILRDNTKDKTPIIGYIGVRMVKIYLYPMDTYWEADDFSELLGQEIGFLLNVGEVKEFYDHYDEYDYNFLGHIYQFDLLEEYQGIGIEDYFINNLGYIIQEKKKRVSLLGATLRIFGTNCDNTLIRIEFCRNRKFEAPIKDEIIDSITDLNKMRWNNNMYAYALYDKSVD